MTVACRRTTAGSITVTLGLVGPDTHVLLAVTYGAVGGPASPPRGRRARSMSFPAHRSAVAPAAIVDNAEPFEPGSAGAGAGAVGASARNVGIGSLPAGLSREVLGALAAAARTAGGGGDADGARTSATFRMHSTATTCNSSGGAGHADAPLLNSELFGPVVSQPFAAQIAAALGGAVGIRACVVGGAASTQFWLLLPATAAPVAGSPTTLNLIEVGTAGTGAAAAAAATAPPKHGGAARAPYEVGPGEAIRPEATSPTAAAAATGRAPAVVVNSAIVVDDEGTLRRLAERMMGRVGLRCVTLEDGSELAGAIKPDTGIVLLDIVMKRSDGVQVGGRCCSGHCGRAVV